MEGMDKQVDEILENGEGQQPATSPEEKLAKFKEIGARRVSKACKAIRILGTLSNRSSYIYDQSHVDKMFAALEKALVETKSKFQLEEDSFKFDD